MFSFNFTETYNRLVHDVANLVSNRDAIEKLKRRNLNISMVAWEDTSRNSNSCWGSNISDLTLKVGTKRLPIIRSDNFTDVTVDLTSDKLPMLVVGNETGSELTKVTLREYLENFNKYCGIADVNRTNLYHSRDMHVLTSAQACILPTDKNRVEFAVDLYNYQSNSEPAVLVVMATSYGTSAQVVSGGNTVLHFNGNGKSRLFRAERLTEYRISQGRPIDGPMTSEEKSLNGIYIFQIPLKMEKNSVRYSKMMSTETNELNTGYSTALANNTDYLFCYCSQKGKYDDEMENGIFDDDCRELMPRCQSVAMNTRGMERAILTVGEEMGPFKGIMKTHDKPYQLVRDSDRPIRLTVQFYMCTDSDKISDSNVDEIANQIRHIYEQGLNEGSLVVNGQVPKPGAMVGTKQERPTASASEKPYVPSFLPNGIL